MSLWQLAACVEGWNRVHGVQEEKAPTMSSSEYDAMLERHADWIATVH